MSLFTSPIDSIKLVDVETFCKEGVAENVRVEYKRELSGASDRKQVAKEVSAMANTQGGVIIYGVDEERPARRPKLPLVGMAAVPDPAARIKSICLDAIYPPIEPEVQTCALPDGRVVAVVRVQESEETPHSIEGKTEWYVRAQDICDPRPATEDELEWLRNRRSKADAFRMFLLERGKRRFKSIPHRHDGIPELHVTSVPAFPSRELLSLSRLHEISGGQHPQTHNPFIGSDSQLLQDGVVFKKWHRNSPGIALKVYQFGQLDRYGAFSFSTSLYEIHEAQVGSGIILSHLIVFLHDTLSYFSGLYKLAGYWGLVDIRVSILNARKRGLALDIQHTREVAGSFDFDDTFSFERRIRADELADGVEPLLIQIVQELRWAFDVTNRTLDNEFLAAVIKLALAKRSSR